MAEPMKIRAQMQGDVADVKVLMNHPMETCRRKDTKGETVPAHFIQNVTATWNGKTVMEAQWSTAVSKNPFLEFKVKGAQPGDKIIVSWTDNKGDKNSVEATVN